MSVESIAWLVAAYLVVRFSVAHYRLSQRVEALERRTEGAEAPAPDGCEVCGSTIAGGDYLRANGTTSRLCFHHYWEALQRDPEASEQGLT